jgi:nucleoside-diphosphate-sugar epimerase
MKDMNILVIGGTYFLGRAFVKIAEAEHSLTLLNRGNNMELFNEHKNLKSYKADRHNSNELKTLSGCKFDVVVDFCAYEPGDIEKIVNALEGQIGQYIFISTCDVYKRGTGSCMSEESELEDRNFGGAAGDYITGKAALEKELSRVCSEYDIFYNSIRPAFIYGAWNYAPRESLYFKMISGAAQVLFPVDADGTFQMVYVDDVAKAILKICGNSKAYNNVYNLCQEERLTYESFGNALRQATGVDFQNVDISVEEVNKRGIPLPFPLTHEESQWYSGEKIKSLGISYTPLTEGLKVSYEWFLDSIKDGQKK